MLTGNGKENNTLIGPFLGGVELDGDTAGVNIGLLGSVGDVAEGNVLGELVAGVDSAHDGCRGGDGGG